MVLSGKVAKTLAQALPRNIGSILGSKSAHDIKLWAVHPGGRSILDAIGAVIDLDEAALSYSRGAAAFRQHVLCDGYVCSENDAR